jgi:NitT/TauT family transport system permease protein
MTGYLKRRDLYIAYLVAAAIVALFLLFWEHAGPNDAILVSRPWAVLKSFGDWFSEPALRNNIPISLEEAGIALVASIAIAIPLAALMASSKLAAALAAPYISLWNGLPKIALAPVFIFVFGIGVYAKVYFAASATFIVPFFAMYRGLTTVDVTIIDHAKILGANRRQLIWDVYVPSCVGTSLATLRVAAQYALIAAILSELIASSKGIGYVINIALNGDQPALMISGALLITLMAFAVDRIVRLLERHFLRWKVGM